MFASCTKRERDIQLSVTEFEEQIVSAFEDKNEKQITYLLTNHRLLVKPYPNEICLFRKVRESSKPKNHVQFECDGFS